MNIGRSRRFWLENERGELVPLNGENGIYFTEPDGLGLDADAKYAGEGGFFLRAEDAGDRQARPGGKLLFRRGNPYMSYLQFTDWLLTAGTLTLVYMPPKQADLFRRRVELKSIEKTETDRAGWLVCPVRFAVLTPWLIAETLVREVTGSGAEPFRVGVGRLNLDRLTDGLDFTATVRVRARGQLPGAIILTQSRGSLLARPVITVTGAESGTEYGRCTLRDVPAGAELQYGAEPRGEYVRAVWPDGRTEDLFPAVDLAWEPFPRLPLEEACDVTLRTSAARVGTMRVQVRQYRRTV